MPSLLLICQFVYVSSRSRVYCASVTRHNILWAVMKRAYLMTVIDGVFCVGRACDKQTLDAFQPSRLTGVRLRAVITLQTLW